MPILSRLQLVELEHYPTLETAEPSIFNGPYHRPEHEGPALRF